MASSKKSTKGVLMDLCVAHSQIENVRKMHKRENGSSETLTKMYDQNIRELESKITYTVKSWLNPEASQRSK
jgi:hypothetical protein